jgi:hypothetical protein
MLNRVAGENVQRVVTLVIGVQFGIQILGFAIGSSADVMGPVGVLCFHVVVYDVFCRYYTPAT